MKLPSQRIKQKKEQKIAEVINKISTTSADNKRTRSILVLGGYGFIGRYTIEALNQANINAIIGTRRAKNHDNECQIKLHETLTEQQWESIIDGIDEDVGAVINTVGILRERKNESFDAVHHLAVDALARACHKQDIPLIHMSALGIDDEVKREFTTSKLRGEQAIQNSQCRGAMVRASIVNAPDGYGSGWMHDLATWPVWILPGGAIKQICPIEAQDLGEALAILAIQACNDTTKKPAEVIEVGGTETYTLKTYLLALRAKQQCEMAKPLCTIRIPSLIAKWIAYAFDVVHITPYSIGHHDLLEHDNKPKHNRLVEILGREPLAIGKTIRKHPNDKIRFIDKNVW